MADRCGAFGTATGDRCRLEADHAGEHDLERPAHFFTTMDDWRIANNAWKASDRSGPRPVYDPWLPDCESCGGFRVRPDSPLPAFPNREFLNRMCKCATPSPEKKQ